MAKILRCALHAGHGGTHLWIATTTELVLLGECPRRAHSRQSAWQADHQTRGLCRYCDQPLAPGSRATCTTHLLAQRQRGRARQGNQPRRPGGRGRPPLFPDPGGA